MIAYKVLQITVLILVAFTGSMVALTRNPKRQVFVAGIFGMLQAILFYTLHSPDVALSELAIGSIALPTLVLATLAKLERTK